MTLKVMSMHPSCTPCACKEFVNYASRLSTGSVLASISFNFSSSVAANLSFPSLLRDSLPLQMPCDRAQSTLSPPSSSPENHRMAYRSRPGFSHGGSGHFCICQGDSNSGNVNGRMASLKSTPPGQYRRQLVGITIVWICLLGLHNAGLAIAAEDAEDAEEQGVQEESPASRTPKSGLVQKLLERSKANKAKNDAERLNGYYRRNYMDYFNFIKGSIMQKDKDKLTEAERGILEWLEKNK